MTVSRTFGIVFLFIAFACGRQDKDQAAASLQSTGQETQQPSTVLQSDTSFSRLHASSGQTIYVPVYSHIYQLNQRKTFNLTATLSIRNADVHRPFTLTRVLYFDSEGNLVKNYLEKSISINPLASTSFVVEEDDLRGGVGANFIVAWKAVNPVFPPVIEAVMISTSQQQGISFVSVGRVLENKNPDLRPDNQ